MKNQTSLLRWAGLCALVLFACVFFGPYAQGVTETKKEKDAGRADVVTIDAMAEDGKLELPPVTFLHDQHTKALAESKKDCSSCHKPEKDGVAGSFSFRYMGADTVKGTALKDLYHKNCIGCHAETASAGKKSGPLEAECRSCHNPRPATPSSWQDIGFDKVLHFKHTSSPAVKPVNDPKLNCGACHHVYDASAKKLVWGKDKEDSCRACHLPWAKQEILKKKTPDLKDENGMLAERPNLGAAGHRSCVNCHLNVQAQKLPDIKAGPVDCAGCHGPVMQAQLKKELADDLVAGSIPRLMRGQPDAVLMLPVAASTDKQAEVKSSMRPAAFNHVFHEGVTNDCRTCHHKKIAACADCHVIGGKAEGGFVSLGAAMHKASTTRSCIGCHNQQTAKPECAGCHASMPKGMTKSSCAGCHTTPVGVSVEEAENGSLLKAGKERRAQLAAATVAARESARNRTFDQTDIPDVVPIGILTKEYEPAQLPHRKIVKALMDKQEKNRLAGVFHTQKATVCEGCHHNSPPSKTPPKCVSCHGTDVRTANDTRPNLKAAYHLQCMACHAAMQQKPLETDCKDCHKPRGN